MRFRGSKVTLSLLSVCVFASSVQGINASAQSEQTLSGSYLISHRTSAHVSRSSADVFHNASEAVKEYLQQSHVRLVSDPLRPMIQTEEVLSKETMLRLAKDAGATHLLYLTVDRPATQWIKLTLECYDLSGNFLWEETANSGMGGINGKNAIPKTMEKLKRQLQSRMGKPGLAQVTEESSGAPKQ